MDDSYRKLIFENIDQLVENTEFNRLLQSCLSYKIISDIMATYIENTPGDQKEKHKALFRKLTKRGPNAYEQLVNICKELKYTDAMKILRPGEYSGQFKERKKVENQQNNIEWPVSTNILQDGCIRSKATEEDYPKLEIYPFETKHNINKFVRKSKKIHTHNKLDSYQMCTTNRGVFFAVNIIDFSHVGEKERGGAVHDGQNLIYLFREFGFEVFYYENLMLHQFEDLLQQLLKSDYVKKAECFVMALMTHGRREDQKQFAEFSRGTVASVEIILSKFSNSACSSLCGKPKVFLFPFCRGDTKDKGVLVEKQSRITETDTSTYRGSNEPTYSDIHICYGTVPGFETFRETDSGSWYVRVLCEVWAEHAHDTSFDDLLKLVGQKLGTKRISNTYYQTTSEEYWGVHKKLFFNPGYVEDVLQ